MAAVQNFNEPYNFNGFTTCPDEIKTRAVCRDGEWIASSFRPGSSRHISEDGQHILLSVMGYDGGAEDDIIVKWSISCPTSNILAAHKGTWIVPVCAEGGIFVSRDEQDVEKVVLHLAEEIWEKTRKSPNLEIIRVDSKKGFRIYSIWFPFRGAGPLVESQPFTL